MTPELKVFVFAGAMIAFAYTALYPRLRTKSLNRVMVLDLAVSMTMLMVVGAVYFGAGIKFSLLFIDVPWWAFALFSATIVEVPFFLWFCKSWGINLTSPPE